MGETKHTPGPWHVDDGTFEGIETGVYSADALICVAENGECMEMAFGDERWSVHEANARLIAAAPDLLAALSRLHEIAHGSWFGDDGTDSDEERAAMVAARAAIAKATGPKQ
jgi:hypothetical protein